MDSLKDLLKPDDEHERVGFVLQSGEIVEVENICHDPRGGFEVRGEDLMKYMGEAIATWHTHPGQDCNLSPNDWYGFKNYPNLRHYIIGTDGVAEYYVNDAGMVLRAE